MVKVKRLQIVSAILPMPTHLLLSPGVAEYRETSLFSAPFVLIGYKPYV